MDSRTNVDELVWRKIWRRFCHFDYWKGGMIKTWRRVWRRVPANYSPTSYPPPSTDSQLITYADCEAFFEAVTEGSRQDLIEILNTNGPEVTCELSKSYNEQGETPLLAAIKRGNVDMVKFLVGKLDVPIRQIGRFVWRDVEYLEVPALYVAIVLGEMGIAAYLLSKEVNSDQTNEMIDSIISSPNDRQAKINILELMGAVNFYFHETHSKPENGLMYWREALNLRNATIDGEPAIPKTSPASDCARITFDFTSEFTTLEQLGQFSTLQLLTQGILVSHRVLNTVSPGPHIFNLIFLCQYASAHFFREGRQAIDILTFCLQQSQELQWKADMESILISWALYIITKVITDLREKRLTIGQEEFAFTNLMVTFDFATRYVSDRLEHHKIKESRTLRSLADSILEMTTWLIEMMPQLNSQERQHFEDSLSLFFRKDYIWRNAHQNLLHMICSKSFRYDMIHLPDDLDYQMTDLDDRPIGLDILRFNIYFDGNVESDFDLVSENNSDSNSDSNSTDSESVDSLSSDSNSTDSGSVDPLSVDPLSGEPHGNTDSDSTDELNNDIDSDSSSDDGSDFSEDTDVSGSTSRGNDGRMSPDEIDDRNFVLIRNHHENMGIQNGNTAPQVVDLQLSVMQLFLRLGADPNAADSFGYTPLHNLAIYHGSVAQAQMLLEYGAHIDQPDTMNRTPLWYFQKWERQLTERRNLDLKRHLQYLINYSLPLPLKCLVARVVSKNQILFDQENAPPTIQSFIQRH